MKVFGGSGVSTGVSECSAPRNASPSPTPAAATALGHPVPCGVTCVCVPISVSPPCVCPPPPDAALTAALEAEKAKALPDMGACPRRVSLPSLFTATPKDASPIPTRPQSPLRVPRFTGNVSADSWHFLLYNEDHRKCVEANGQQLTATTCRPEAAAQRFQWLPGGRLRGWGSQRCVTAPRAQNLVLLRLEPCRDGNELQRWECRGGGLLALAGYNLYFNYGNNMQQTVMLYTGDRKWSRWVIHGSKDDVCSRAC